MSRRVMQVQPAQPPQQPDGTSQNPFLIAQAADFVAIKNNLIGGNTLPYFYKVVNNIDFTDVAIPFSASEAEFHGHIDGNFKKFSNITMSGSSDLFGIFRNLGGSIKYLKFENINIQNSGTGFCGICGGVGNNTTIERCWVTGIVKTTNRGGSAFVGAGNNTGSIINCINEAIVQTNNYPTGGFVGQNYSVNFIIQNCLSLGNISSGNGETSGYIGYTTAANTIRNCVAAMNTITTNNTNGGRIQGNATSSLTNNYALNTMTVKGATVSGNANDKNGANATIQQLKSRAFYENTLGWDFTNVWEIDEGNGFPTLKGFN